MPDFRLYNLNLSCSKAKVKNFIGNSNRHHDNFIKFSTIFINITLGDGTLTPKETITRAELAKILYVAYTGNPYTAVDYLAGVGKFYDVPAEEPDTGKPAWYAGVVNYAAHEGWILGYGDGNFGPNDPVKGVDAITMILRMLGYGAYGELADGTTYEVNALTLAEDLGMLKNTGADVNYTAAGAREEVFDYLYQAMYAPCFVKTVDSDRYQPDEYYSGRYWKLADFADDINIPGYDERDPLFIQRDLYLRVTDDVLLAVPETNPIHLIDVDDGEVTLYAKFNGGGVVETASEISADLLGHYVHVVYDANEDVVYHVGAISEAVELKVMTASDLNKAELSFSSHAVTLVDGLVLPGLYGKTVDGGIAEGTYYVADGEIVTRVLENNLYTLAEVRADKNSSSGALEYKVAVGTKNNFSAITNAKTAADWAKDGGEISITAEGNTFTPDVAVSGLEKITAPGLYLCIADVYGHTVEISVLDPVDYARIQEVKELDNVPVSFRAGDVVREIYKDVGEDTIYPFDVDDLELDLNAFKYIYEFGGKVVVVTDKAYGPDKVDVPIDFDGFMKAKRLQAVIKYTPAVEDNKFTEADETAPENYEIIYARVLGYNDKGVEKAFDLKVEYGKDRSGHTYAYVIYNGEEIVLYTETGRAPRGLVHGEYLVVNGGNSEGTILPYVDEEDGSISLLTFNDINLYRTEQYTLVDGNDDKINKDETTVYSHSGTPYLAEYAQFVGRDNVSREIVAFTGSSNMPKDYMVVADIVTVTIKGKTEAFDVFGGAIANETVTPKVIGYVLIDADDNKESVVDPATGNTVYTYQGLTVDGEYVYLKSDTALEKDGFYEYKDNGYVGNVKTLSSTPVKLSTEFDHIVLESYNYCLYEDGVTVYGDLAAAENDEQLCYYVINTAKKSADVWAQAEVEAFLGNDIETTIS